MNTQASNDWFEANQRVLSAALALVRHVLERSLARARNETIAEEQQPALQHVYEEALTAMTTPAALTRLCAAFDLSPFERDMLLLCAGIELDSSFASLCAQAGIRAAQRQGGPDGNIVHPTFSLALAALPDAHWDALTSAAPLRRWQLITLGVSSTLTLSSLRIDECILHYLVGISQPDERLASALIPISLSVKDELVPSHRILAERLTSAWLPELERTRYLSLPRRDRTRPAPVIYLCGEDSAGKQAIAATVCHTLDMRLNLLAANMLPIRVSELDQFMRLWEREAALSDSTLLLDCDEVDTTDTARIATITRFLQQTHSPLILTMRERLRFPQSRESLALTFDVQKPAMSEQLTLWQHALGAIDLNGHVEALASQFHLSSSALRTACAEIVGTNGTPLPGIENLGEALWDACRAQARPGLNDLAQHIEPRATWHDLVLPEAQQQVLHEIAAHVRQRATVYERWGFAERGTRGLGISALFTGTSGTGKTLAAEVLANELRLDLYRIDLSSVVSKYIGETEKNLRRVFDAAEAGGAILLFDEADALFGKRSEVKDSHDRYANIEVGYLLQRMEAYRGLAILTTNLKNSLDTAFLRRIRFIVHFPFPGMEQRVEIWRRIFPERTPTEELDFNKLAKLNMPGGNIRNIALNAAFLAADARQPVRMAHLLRAAASEYAKLEKPLTESEIGGWV